MKDLKEKEVFRLAAVLYSESNYEVTPKTIHRKIIESVFIDNKNQPLSIQAILDFIESNYNLIFSYDEVSEILNSSTDENFLIYCDQTNELVGSLTPKRKLVLESRVNQSNIDYFIDEFLALNIDTFGVVDGKAIIYKFLYDILNNNISSFSKLIDYKKDLTGAINIDDSFNTVEKQIINSFLQWDNDGKNKAIFDISSYALEYCLITNNKATGSFHLKNLKNKIFYLDTNIIFRAIGINGESRSTKTNTFLGKFKEAGETLLISSFTEAEYKATIKYYVEQISKRRFHNVSPRVFKQFNKDSEFFDYYQRWRVGRTNDSIKYFETHLLSEYEAFKQKFDIKEDYNIPFNDKNEDIAKEIIELANDIFSFKYSEKVSHVRYDTCISDAKNLFLIKERRNGHFRNIFETKYFFISSDQSLRRWDFKNNSSTPAVLLPSQWLSIILRYINRTNDDFKSFVSFLNLSQNETKLTNEQLQLILVGIGEITMDVQKQSGIVQVMIDQDFKGVLEKNISDDEIIERSKTFAKSKLEADLDEVTEHYHILNENLGTHINVASAALQEMQMAKQTAFDKNKVIESENRELKNELLARYVNKKLFWWQFPGFVAIIALFCLVVFYLLVFTFTNKSYNYPYKVVLWVNALPKDSLERDIAKAIFDAILPLSGIGSLSVFVRNRLLSKSKRQAKLSVLYKSAPEKYI